VLGELERAVELRGAGIDLAATDHRLLQGGHAAGGDRWLSWWNWARAAPSGNLVVCRSA
jgi:hypothetical protein